MKGYMKILQFGSLEMMDMVIFDFLVCNWHIGERFLGKALNWSKCLRTGAMCISR